MIFVYPRHIVEQAIEKNHDFKQIPIISISNFGHKLQNVDNLNILQLEFLDDSVSFTEKQARRVKEFVDKNKDSNTFYVHCDAGISRSGAVGLWITRYLGFDENQFYEKNKRIHPSSYVLGELNKIANTNYKIRNRYDKFYEYDDWK